MENKIAINEYVRTKKRGIFKVLSIRKTAYGYLCGTTDNLNNGTFTIGKGGSSEIKNDIVKHSFNLIDLLEEGDYVNGKEVKHIAWFEGIPVDYKKLIFVDRKHLIPGESIEEKDIKSIVTKEQFKSVEYIVGGKE